MASERWQQIERLYHQALGREVRERGAFLDDACGSDEALQREVESLLANESKAAGFLSAPAVEAAAKLMAQDTSQLGVGGLESGVNLVGRELGGYRILSHLGAGGMGEVYRARDPKLGRDVAIKVLPEVFTVDRERLARFEREARLLASLNHPHIGAIYGFEEADGVRGLVGFP